MSNQLTIQSTSIADLKIIQRHFVADHRGYFERLFCSSDLDSIFGLRTIKQINHSQTKSVGTIRGMHFQYPPFAETKIVSCIKGRIFDVAIDIRKGSTTYLQWFGLELDDSSGKSLFIPEGFAHGFQSLEPSCEILYFVSAPYCKSSESGINALDPRISVNWPIHISERSEKDSTHPMLEDFFPGVDLSFGIT